MDCSVLGIHQGSNKNCNWIRDKIIGITVQDYDDPNFAPRSGHTLDDVTDIDNWKTRANNGKVARFNFAGNATSEGGDAVTVDNDSNGRQYHKRYNLVSYLLKVETNENDYKEMQRVYKPGKLHKVFIEFPDIVRCVEYVSDGLPITKGFDAEIVVNPNNLPVEDTNDGFQVKITLWDQDEMDSSSFFRKPTNFANLIDAAVPDGLTLKVEDISTIATGDLFVETRGGVIKTGLVADDFLLDGSASGAAFGSDNTDGTYTIDLTGVKLVQVKVGSPGSYTEVSGVLDLSKLSA